jgi:CBS domain-containing protein
MQAKDIMTRDPQCCSAHDSLKRVAAIMREESVGEVPVIDEERKLLGVITDRDIIVRCVAAGDVPSSCRVEDYMTAPALWLQEDTSLEQIANLMIVQAIRRVPITDGEGTLRGIVALADLDRSKARSLKSRVSQHVSRPH